MRAISYIISFFALILLANIVLSYSLPSYRDFLKNVKGGQPAIAVKAEIIPPKVDYTDKIVNSIEKLYEHINSLESNLKKEETSTGINTETGTVKVDELEKIPGSLKQRLEKLKLKKIPNTLIFDIRKLDKNIDFTTYSDTPDNIVVYVFEATYGVMMDQFRVDKTYKVNEANNFFGYSFYLNPIKKDNKVRFVIQIEGRSVGFEVTKGSYDKLKSILLK